MRSWRAAMLVGGMLIAPAATGAAAAAVPVRDPDWPCGQIKVASLTPAAMWNGPSAAAYAKIWSQDPQVAALVSRLVQRRLPLDQAKAEIATFASAATDRRAALLTLFAGLFEVLNTERSAVQAGLDRFGRRQKQMAEDLRTEMEALHAAQDAGKPEDEVSQMVNKLTWDTRVFEQRRQMVSTACDVPNVIEERLFALTRLIQDALGPQASGQ